jgi:isopentenyldiphosphate isomerase
VSATSGGELVDIVDAEDRVVDVVTRAAMRAGGLRHRAVYLVIRSSTGDVLVHRRSFDKDIAPGWWDVAVGGVVAAGEDFDDAARRELAEEVGVVDAAIEPVGAGRYDAPGLQVVGRVYRVAHDGPFTFADGEVIAAEWVTPERLDALLTERPFCADSVALCQPWLGGS